MEKSVLLTQIANAFPEGPLPAKEDVLSKGCYPGDPESEEIKDFFGGRPWKSITPGDVFNFRPALCFLPHGRWLIGP